MKSNLGDKERLGHIKDAIAFINSALINKTESDFLRDFILHTAIQKWLENIGEASYKLTRSFKSSHPQIAWRNIEGLRHVLVHEYFGIDLPKIWETVQDDLPFLQIEIDKLLTEFE
jgi:uncharacterized protein with HEPN domain